MATGGTYDQMPIEESVDGIPYKFPPAAVFDVRKSRVVVVESYQMINTWKDP